MMRGHDSSGPVLCVGAVTFDTVFRVARVPADDERVVAEQAISSCGGPAATAAVTLAKLGVPVALAARVGADAAGKAALEQLEGMGVDTQLVVRDPDVATPISAILLDGQSHGRRIVTSPPLAWRGTLAPPEGVSGGWAHVDHVGWAAVTGLRKAHAHQSKWRVSVDGGNPVPSLDLRGVDLYAPTLSELRRIFDGGSDEDRVLAAIGAGAGAVVATDGPRPVLVAAQSDPGAVSRVATFTIQPVSTLGAGDVFHGGLIAGLYRGLELADAVRFANATAALSCRALDGQSGIPSGAEVEALIAANTND